VKKNKYCLFFIDLHAVLQSISKAQTNPYQRFLDSLISVFSKEKTDSVKGLIALDIAQKKIGTSKNTGNFKL